MNGREKTVRGYSGVNTQIRQICIDYSTLIPLERISLDEIRFFYEPLIGGLIRIQENQSGQ